MGRSGGVEEIFEKRLTSRDRARWLSVAAETVEGMTVQQLRAPVVTGLVDAASQAIDEAAAVPVGSLTHGEIPATLTRLAQLEAKVAAMKLEVLAEADARRVAEEAAAARTDAWAAGLTGSTAAVMRGGIWLAKLLRERYHHTREAFARGRINEAQARVIVRASEDLPGQVTDEERAAAEAGLVAKAAAGMHAKNLRRAARRMLDKIRDDLADQHEADSTGRDESRAERETWLGLWDNGDGTYSGKFTIPELHGRLLATFLERLTAPRRLSRNRAGESVTDETIENGLDNLSWTEQLGVGFCELLEHLPTDGHHGVAATLLVNVDYQHLLDQLASAGLDTGATITVGESRRLACNAGILPAVLGGASEVLDLGRTRRLHSEAQRRALATRHDSCAAEGCERPFAWCEIHHPHAWADGGRTDIANALPLCFWHHRRAHDDRFDLRVLSSGEVRYRRRR